MILTLIDWILFILLALCVSYLLVYAIASKFYRSPNYPKAGRLHRIAVFFPAYQEDKVIVDSVRSFLEQDYPKEMYDVYVISDHMQDTTNDALNRLLAKVLIADYTNSTKAKALNIAVKTALPIYDIAVIMDADNVTTANFLSEVNLAYSAGVKAMQAHRTGKKLDTAIARLDAVSEEINNGIFRSGHNHLGLSASLSGSGMAFEYDWFKKAVPSLKTVGEDKELELLLIQDRIHITYLPHIPVYDEKNQKKDSIKKQRKRWMITQFDILRLAIQYLQKKGIAHELRNPDLIDKVIQWLLPPRLLQLAAVFSITFLMTIICISSAPKWWVLSLAQMAAMLVPIPKQYMNRSLLKSLLCLPPLIVSTIGNLFRLKGANKKFIHTKHGE